MKITSPPLPGLATGSPDWRVVEGAPMTDVRDKVLSAPIDLTAESAVARMHEMMHARFTPPDSWGRLDRDVPNVFYQGAEDVRLGELLRRDRDRFDWYQGNADPTGKIAESNALALRPGAPNERTNEIVGVYASVCGLEPVRKRFRREMRKAAKHNGGEDAALRMERLLDAAHEAVKKATKTWSARDFDHFTGSLGRELSNLVNREEARREIGDDRGLERMLDESEHRESPTGPWCPMDILTPRLDVAHKVATNARRLRPADAGFMLGDVLRVFTDGRIYMDRRPVEGGTVLVDASGSMGMDAEDLARVLAAVPGATVACYAGDGVRGRLVVAAKNGRMLSNPEAHVSGSNSCDGPAIDWLVRQRGPFVWFSDGYVNGRDCRVPYPELIARLAATLRQHRVPRVQTVKGVIDALQGKVRYGSPAV